METVKIFITDIEDLFNKFDSNDISDELALYIENRCSRLRKTKMRIKIISKEEIDDLVKERLVDAIRSHFGLEVKYSLLDIKRTNIINIICFLIGLFILLFKNVLPFTKTISEIIDILGCFLIWEGTFSFLFMNNDVNTKIIRAKKICSCQIEFEED